MKKSDDIFYSPDIKDDHLSHSYERFEVQADILVTKENSPSLKKGISPAKISLLFFVLLLGFFVILGKIFSLQVVFGKEYRGKAENNRIKVEKVTATRGVIYDKNGRLLVKNSPNFTLYFTPAELPKDINELNPLAQELSAIINLSADEIINKFTSANKLSSQPFLIKEYLNYDQALKLKITINDYPFLNLEIQLVRDYLTDESFSHLLGYMSKVTEEELKNNSDYSPLDYTGKTGLEHYYEKELKGKDGKQQIERDNLNKFTRILATQEPEAGKNLVLNIDYDLQATLFRALKTSVQTNHSPAGAAVALNPQNGQVLALVSYPAYDNNLFFKGLSPDQYKAIFEDPNQPLLNRAISGEYPSGSTIKPTIAAAALQEKIITPTTTVLSTGGIKIDKWFFPDWKAGGHGLTNVVKALAESVNTFFYAVAGGYQNITGLGVDRLVKYFKLFGLGQKLGIDLPGETTGFLPSIAWKEEVKNEPWYIGDTYHLGIGQGDILVSPLQVASYTAVIANGGKLYQPYLVNKFTDLENNPVAQNNSHLINQGFISSANLQVVRQGMRSAVVSGSAGSLADLPFSVAAKTGTAQFANNKRTHAWLTSFAPFENPEIVISVIVEQGGEGYVAALPVAREALICYFNSKQ